MQNINNIFGEKIDQNTQIIDQFVENIQTSQANVTETIESKMEQLEENQNVTSKKIENFQTNGPVHWEFPGFSCKLLGFSRDYPWTSRNYPGNSQWSGTMLTKNLKNLNQKWKTIINS